MPVSKVIFGQQTIIDLTNDTITPDKMLSGTTAHQADGTVIQGTITAISNATIDTIVGS